VKEYCIGRGFSWVASVASTACPEAEYYEDLLRFYRQQKRVRAGARGVQGAVQGRCKGASLFLVVAGGDDAAAAQS
jgi:hypothetical protein